MRPGAPCRRSPPIVPDREWRARAAAPTRAVTRMSSSCWRCRGRTWSEMKQRVQQVGNGPEAIDRRDGVLNGPSRALAEPRLAKVHLRFAVIEQPQFQATCIVVARHAGHA